MLQQVGGHHNHGSWVVGESFEREGLDFSVLLGLEGVGHLHSNGD